MHIWYDVSSNKYYRLSKVRSCMVHPNCLALRRGVVTTIEKTQRSGDLVHLKFDNKTSTTIKYNSRINVLFPMRTAFIS